MRFRVYGVPQSQGSMRAFLPKGRTRPVVTHQKTAALKAWRQSVLEACPKGELVDGPVVIEIEFFVPAPKARPSVLKTDRQRAEWAYPARRPDLDKMTRGVLDALTGVAFSDDSQVVSMVCTKSYADLSNLPGAEIAIWSAFLRGV